MKRIDHHILAAYGWNEHWEKTLSLSPSADTRLSPARVVAQYSRTYAVMTESGEHRAVVTGKFEFHAAKRSDYPAVGDWVLVERLPNEERAVIHALLPRKSAMVRKAAGNVAEDQVVGANLDDLFIVNALNRDFNPRRIERYLVAAWDSGARPIVLLTKADLRDDPVGIAAQVERIAPGVPVHAVSALLDQGIDDLAPYLQPGRTIGIAGSSGAGKSTLLNWLAGESLQETQGIREHDARGRHTTTHRELFLLNGGALVMDTPGMRELQLWEADDGWHHAFADIESLAGNCRFRDCRHAVEAGCAVLAAVDAGELDPKRLANYRKTGRELARLARKDNVAAGKAGKKPARPNRARAQSRPGRQEYGYED